MNKVHPFYLVLAWTAIYLLMVGVGYLIDVPGSDWFHHWLPRQDFNSYPPWIVIILDLLPDLPFLSGLTLTSLLFCLWRRNATIWQFVAAFCSLPLYWTLWLGQIDSVPMLGLALLPWGVPLVLIKPQVAIWYLWVWWRQNRNRWRVAAGMLVFLAITFLLWGWWPSRFEFPYAFRTEYDLSAWRIHWSLGILLLIGALIENDPDRAMALGALGAPYIQGTSYIVLLPVFSRLRRGQLGIAWLMSWAGVVAIPLGDDFRRMAALFPLTIWFLLLLQDGKVKEEWSKVLKLVRRPTAQEPREA